MRWVTEEKGDECKSIKKASECNDSSFFRYNYDIVNDVPLKVRFEWVELKS